jgi:pimeloyl-ACP methyl ester carboxylesterase
MPTAKTHAFRWSGRNSDRDRASAGKALVRETSELRAEYPEAEVVVVGHSHGGNVALKAYGEVGGPASIDKIICLGTPFFHFAARALKPAANVIASGLIAILCLTLVLHRAAEIWTSSVVPIIGSDPNQRIDENTGLPEFNEDEYSKFLAAAMRAVYSVMFFAALPPLLFLAVKPFAWICEKLLAKLQAGWLNRNPPPTRHPPTFVLYTRGDEARGWLWFIERVWRPVFTGLFVIGQISTKTLILVIPLAFVAIARSISQNRSDDFLPYFGAFGTVVLLVGFTYLSTIGALFLSFLAMVYGTVVAGTPWGFGTAGLISYQLISVRVSHCPDELTNVQVREVTLEKPPGPRTLRHSLFYCLVGGICG